MRTLRVCSFKNPEILYIAILTLEPELKIVVERKMQLSHSSCQRKPRSFQSSLSASSLSVLLSVEPQTLEGLFMAICVVQLSHALCHMSDQYTTFPYMYELVQEWMSELVWSSEA